MLRNLGIAVAAYAAFSLAYSCAAMATGYSAIKKAEKEAMEKKEGGKK